MPNTLRDVKGGVSRLSDGDLGKFAIWFNRFLTQYERNKFCDDAKGIRPKALLKEFKRHTRNFPKGFRTLPEASKLGFTMFEFYENIRVKGCRFDQDEDMLLLEWFEEGDEYSFTCTRQICWPRSDGDTNMWQLRVDFRYPLTDELKRLKRGNKWFRSLNEDEEYYLFLCDSKVVKALAQTQAIRAKVSYTDVD